MTDVQVGWISFLLIAILVQAVMATNRLSAILKELRARSSAPVK